MGISGFWSFLLDELPYSFVALPPHGSVGTEHLMIDMNGIFHTEIRKAKSQVHFIKRIFSSLNKTVKHFVPSKTLFLAMDGPTSAAKMVTQRTRRKQKAAKNSDNTSKLDSCMLTPGTSLMEKLKESLLYFCYQQIQQNPAFQNVQCIISGSDAPGEGEIKVISWLLENRLKHHPSDRYLIVGGDADLVLLSLGSMTPSLYLSNDVADKYLFSSGEWYAQAETMFPNQSARLAVDFILISLLQGNDYLPKMKRASMALWSLYLDMKRDVSHFFASFLVKEDYTLHWEMFLTLLGNLDNFVAKKMKRKAPASSEETKKMKRKVPASSEETKKMKPASVSVVQNYIQGLLWCVYTYTTGICPDYEYYYKTFRAPSVQELYYYFSSIQSSLHEHCVLHIVPHSQPLPPFVFCLTILPLQAQNCLPEALQPLMNEDSSIYGLLSENNGKSLDVSLISCAVQEIEDETFGDQVILKTSFNPSLLLQHKKRYPKLLDGKIVSPPTPPISTFRALKKNLLFGKEVYLDIRQFPFSPSNPLHPSSVV